MYSRSEAILLQRQKSVRLFAPIRWPTCGMEEDHMRNAFIEENKKSRIREVFIEEYVKHREMENAEVQNLLYCVAKV